jgi:type IV pilus assembly protein PilY1
MDWTYLPDQASNFAWKYGYVSSQCNGVYYNPNITYQPPVDSTGASYSNSSFTAAWKDGFKTSDGTLNLSTSFQPGDGTWATAAYYYAYSGSQAVKNYSNTNSTFYKECNSDFGSTPGKNVFTKVTVSATSGPGGTDERQNFANWYSYYRSRMQMMKTAAGRAFASIDNRYRVGFMTINTSRTTTGTEFLDIGTYDATQKASWYSTFYAVQPTGGTPLRAALSKAGRIFAGKTGTDPVQYSCQQNFAILSTDGYWNGAAGYRLDGSTDIGNVDNDLTTVPRPFYDGGGTSASDTLADVAYYYYTTDLRTTALGNCTGALGGSVDVCEDNVPPGGEDTAAKQHMTTFTLGLGNQGKMAYSPTYKTDTSGDYLKVKNGDTGCSWLSGGATCKWPVPGSDKVENIDDMWHAAVNGRGTYFTATDPTSLASGLKNALAGVNARTGSSAAATTSNPNVTSGDNFVFSSTFTTLDWTGELIRQQMDLNTGAISTAIDWRAQGLLDAKVGAVSDTRTIYTFSSAAANKFKSFLWTNLTTAEQAYFQTANISSLSQWCTTGTDCLDATQKTNAQGANLVNFLRGQTGYENRTTNAAANRLYRSRAHVLGDIVSAEAVYVKKPLYNYSDADYATFVTSNTSRQGMVYVAANDGMLHAFNADTGAESFAYIPTAMLPNLFKLADFNYSAQHRYFVDGTPVVGDAYLSGWKTILVGGYNGGGRGYYALDVTNPAAPQALWEFKVRNPSVTACAATTTAAEGQMDDCDVGYSYGNPVITKLPNGTWVVLVASGYNNVSPGDGQGYLYVLNAQTGAIIKKIATGVGSTTTPSGLSKINAWVDNAMQDNTALRAYGGDLLGNVWSFDLTTYTSQHLAALKNIGASAQPITAKPELGLVDNHVVVYVGTGRYLGTTDLADASQQSFYAIKDPLNGTDYGANFRATANVVQQTLTTGTDVSGAIIRTASSNGVNFSTNDGWYIDLPDAGERANTDPALALGTLVFTTNVPNANACTVGGYSWIYYLDYRTGSFVSTSAGQVVARRLGNALATRPVLVRLPNNSVVSLTKLSDTKVEVGNVPIGAGGSTVRRVLWRELFNE